eukprot:m.161764 g.161764  ORF g.161764 m.161764 type:complete len:856 (-) comp9869_c0_seq1:25-2592(-)
MAFLKCEDFSSKDLTLDEARKLESAMSAEQEKAEAAAAVKRARVGLQAVSIQPPLEVSWRAILAGNRERKFHDSLNDDLPERPLNQIGQLMPFLNRDDECKALVRTLYRAWTERDGADGARFVPVCLGLPGIGKSRFARVAVLRLVNIAMNSEGTALPDNVDAAVSAADAIVTSILAQPQPQPQFAEEQRPEEQPEEHRPEEQAEKLARDRRRFVRFVRSLVLACYEDRNLCVTMRTVDDYHSSEQAFASYVLSIWAKTQLGDSPELRDCVASIRSDLNLRLLHVLEYIAAQSGQYVDTDYAFIINIDEAQDTTKLPYVMGLLMNTVKEGGKREPCIQLSIVVTGYKPSAIEVAISASGFPYSRVMLKPLEYHHLVTILDKLFPEAAISTNGVPACLAHCLLWFGGIPRLLELFLLRVRVYDFMVGEDILRPLAIDSREELCDVLFRSPSWRVLRVLNRIQSTNVPADVAPHLQALALTGLSVDRTFKLTPDCTVSDAGDKLWLHHVLDTPTSTTGRIVVPPLFIRAELVPRKAVIENSPSEHLTPDELEAIGIGIPMHRLWVAATAARQAGGLNPDDPITVDLESAFPGCGSTRITVTTTNFGVKRAGTQIREGTVDELVHTALANPNPKKQIAELNAPCAPHADAIIYGLPELVVFEQMKQSLLARRARLLGKHPIVSQVVMQALVEKEVAKISGCSRPYVFVLVTDAEVSPDPCPGQLTIKMTLPGAPNILIYDHPRLPALLGTTTAQLLAFRICASAALANDATEELAATKMSCANPCVAFQPSGGPITFKEVADACTVKELRDVLEQHMVVHDLTTHALKPELVQAVVDAGLTWEDVDRYLPASHKRKRL